MWLNPQVMNSCFSNTRWTLQQLLVKTVQRNLRNGPQMQTEIWRQNSGTQWFNIYKLQSYNTMRQVEVTTTEAVQDAKQFQHGWWKICNPGITGAVKEKKKRQNFKTSLGTEQKAQQCPNRKWRGHKNLNTWGWTGQQDSGRGGQSPARHDIWDKTTTTTTKNDSNTKPWQWWIREIIWYLVIVFWSRVES